MAAVPSHPLVRSFLRATGWSDRRRDVAVYKLNQWHAFLAARGVELVEATRADAEDFFDHQVAAGRAPATVHQSWSMLRALHRWLRDEGECDADPLARIKGPEVPEAPVVVLEPAEYRRLVATCDRRTTTGRRDEAILSLMWWSGLRRSEVVHLDVDAVDWAAGMVTVGSLAFATKNRKVRRIPLAGDTVAALDRYLRRRGHEPGPLFLSQHGDGHADRRLAPDSLRHMLGRRAARAGLDRAVGAHEFRRAMAVRWRAKGGTELGLMDIGGWADIRMIARYTRMHREDLAADEFRRLIDDSAVAARRRGRRVG